MKVTVGIPTKNRYESLAQTVQSVVFQTHQEIDIIIVDDSDSPVDLRSIPAFQNLFMLMNERKIGWKVIYGQKRGQHISHQFMQNEAQTDWIWRIDDDEVAQPDVLSKLINFATSHENVGAVGGLVLIPPSREIPTGAANVISDLSAPNIQWFSHNGSREPIPVDHITSTFLYRKGIADYELNLSPAAHREETLFTHRIKRAGYSLYVLPDAVTWHMRSEIGGIRSYHNPQFWEDDEKLFQDRLREWGINQTPVKTIVLDAGRGDHVIVKKLLPKLKKKYGTIRLATCFPDVFEKDEVEQISIADAKIQLGNLDRFSIYRWCIDHNWKTELIHAFEQMYGV